MNNNALYGESLNIALQNIFVFLDTIDLTSSIDKYKGKDIGELMEYLSSKYEYKDEYSESLFDVVAEEEFVEYLNNKYNLNIRESVTINYYI